MDQDVSTNDPATQGEEVTQGSVPPGHVPLERLNEVLGKVSALETQLARTQGRIEGMAQKPDEPVVPTQTYTRAQLNAAVEAGQIDQDGADRLHEQQLTDKITRDVTKSVTDAQAANSGQTLASSEVAQYRIARPDVLVEGSKDRDRVQDEYTRLTAMGQPANLATEALAMRIAFGPADKLKPGTRDTHQESGGAGADAERETAGKWPKEMGEAQKRYYKGQINNGVYTEKSAIEEWNAARKAKAA